MKKTFGFRLLETGIGTSLLGLAVMTGNAGWRWLTSGLFHSDLN